MFDYWWKTGAIVVGVLFFVEIAAKNYLWYERLGIFLGILLVIEGILYNLTTKK